MSMELQISSGRGPAECELAVGLLACALCAEFPGTIIKSTVPGARDGCYKSAVLYSESDLSHLEGTVKWICPSPIRPNHKRKNWFVDISPIGRYDGVDLDPNAIRFDTFRSGGKGGQNVNKVETGVRATYIPVGISAIATGERSQYMNKKLAMDRLKEMISRLNAEGASEAGRENWMEHNRLKRGEAIREYEGPSFNRIK